MHHRNQESVLLLEIDYILAWHICGGLFRKELRVTDKREILIFITPKVIDDSFVDK